MKNDMLCDKLLLTVIAIALLIMNLSVWIFNPMMGLVHLFIISSIIFILVFSRREKSLEISKTVDFIVNFFNRNIKAILKNLPIALVVVHKSDVKNVVFYSDTFGSEFLNQKDICMFGEQGIISNKKLDNLCHNGTLELDFDGKKYEIIAKNISDFLFVYFKDNTECKNLKQKYMNSRPCVGYIFVDNKDELKNESTDEENLKLTFEVEDSLKKWSLANSGIFEKISDGMYMVFFEEKDIKNVIKNKFNILNDIHKIKIDSSRFVTISGGVGVGANTLNESRNWAKDALNMSLGRGGDQITIKNGKKYDFFGGTSQGIEKRSKVRTRVAARAILERINNADLILIMGHKFSDYDSVGASVGLWSVCKKGQNKNCFIILNRAQTLSQELVDYVENNIQDKIFISEEEAKNIITDNTFLIIVDTHREKFLECEKIYNLCNNVAVIDHHRMSVDKISNAIVFFHEPFASSTCEIVSEMVQYMGDKNLGKVETEALMAGIMLDTKNFSLKAGVRTFEAAAYLKRKGADNVKVKKLFSDSLNSYKLKSKIVENTEIYENCAMSVVEFPAENIKVECAQVADELLNIKGVRASFVIFGDDNVVNISARSMGDINVQVIMENFGGGGHQTMAAAQIKNKSIVEVKQELMKLIKDDNLKSNEGN